MRNSVTPPDVVSLAILLLSKSVSQRFPSGPAAIASGSALAVGSTKSVNPPEVVIRPILLTPGSVNQRLPSGPTAMLLGLPAAGNCVNVPVVVRRPILLVP